MIGAEVEVNGKTWRVDRKVGYSDQYVYLVEKGGVESMIRPVALVQAAILQQREALDGNA